MALWNSEGLGGNSTGGGGGVAENCLQSLPTDAASVKFASGVADIPGSPVALSRIEAPAGRAFVTSSVNRPQSANKAEATKTTSTTRTGTTPVTGVSPSPRSSSTKKAPAARSSAASGTSGVQPGSASRNGVPNKVPGSYYAAGERIQGGGGRAPIQEGHRSGIDFSATATGSNKALGTGMKTRSRGAGSADALAGDASATRPA
ncbi:unnamed protein product, partial [Amoebophrya sp. A25]|eukprot:GSA25T00007612001.1